MKMVLHARFNAGKSHLVFENPSFPPEGRVLNVPLRRTMLFLIGLLCFSTSAFSADLMKVVCSKPATTHHIKGKDWEHSLISGNGVLGVMVEGRLEKENHCLSDGRIFLPRRRAGEYFELAKYKDLAKELMLRGEERRIWDEVIEKASQDAGGYIWRRDPFIGAASLVLETAGLEMSDAYSRSCDFETGEIVVADKGYARRLFVSRVDDVFALKIEDEAKRPFVARLDQMPNGRTSGDAAVRVDNKAWDHLANIAGVRRPSDDWLYYRVDFRQNNGKNPYRGYEVWCLRHGDELFAKTYPLADGEVTAWSRAKKDLEHAAGLGYDRLLERHAPVMRELMGRVTLEIKGQDELVRKFNACRYANLSSVSVKEGIIPNLQGIWSSSWTAPYNGSYTVDGNLPCAMAFWTTGNTPEMNEALYKWILRLHEDFREAAQKGYAARGIHIPGQVTTTGWETAYYRNVELMWWHGGAGWMTGFLWRWFEATQDRAVLKKIYPLLKEAADYYVDVLTELPDGTLGYAPGYSPENAPHGDNRSHGDINDPAMPRGGYSTMMNPTIDVSAAKQAFTYAAKAADIMGTDKDSVLVWQATAKRLAAYRVSADGFWAEWLIQNPPDNNEHRHASHLYALYDEAPAEILDNADFVTAIKKTLDKRMAFHEKEHHMAFGITQIGLAAAKVGDKAVMTRAIDLLASTYFSDTLTTFHDPGWLFNHDITGGFPAIIAEALVTKGPDGKPVFLNAKPDAWQEGCIKGLLLPGGRRIKELRWKGNEYDVVLSDSN